LEQVFRGNSGGNLARGDGNAPSGGQHTSGGGANMVAVATPDADATSGAAGNPQMVVDPVTPRVDAAISKPFYLQLRLTSFNI